MITENKYKAGEIVYDRIRPSQKLVIERCADRIYYCKLQEAPHRKAIVYMERELSGVAFNLEANEEAAKHSKLFSFLEFNKISRDIQP
jgi:hypothetical protein